MRPERGSYPPYFENYIPYVKEDNVMDALRNGWTETEKFIAGIPFSKEDFSYAPGKWTVKEVVNHLIDTERVFAYRALRFARKDPQQPLPFDENQYAANADVSKRSLAEIMDEFGTVRQASISLFGNFNEEVLHRKGSTAAGESTVLALGYTICGHAAHHIKVLRSRYL